MKYIVLWYVLTSWIGGVSLKADPYTGEYPSSVPAIAIFHEEPKIMIRVFDTEKQAIEFIEKAPVDVKNRMKLVVLDTSDHETK